eukprot:jgi/Bigna1/141878/aug1.65_g16586
MTSAPPQPTMPSSSSSSSFSSSSSPGVGKNDGRGGDHDAKVGMESGCNDNNNDGFDDNDDLEWLLSESSDPSLYLSTIASPAGQQQQHFALFGADEWLPLPPELSAAAADSDSSRASASGRGKGAAAASVTRSRL